MVDKLMEISMGEFIGGLRTPYLFNATRPLVRLTVLPDRVRFQLRFGLDRFGHPWEILREDVTSAHISGEGSRFLSCTTIATRNSDEWRFWTLEPQRLMAELCSLNYSVDR